MSLTYRILELTKNKHNELQSQILNKINFIHKMYEPFAEKLEGEQVDKLSDEDWRDLDCMYRGSISASIKLNQIGYTYELLEKFDKNKSIKKRLSYSQEQIKKFKDYFNYLHQEQMKFTGKTSPNMLDEIKYKYPLVCPEEFDDFITSVISDDVLKPEGLEFKRLCVDLLSEAQQDYHNSINGWILDFATTKTLELFEDIYHTAKANTSD